MPRRALRPCGQQGCGTLVERGRCAQHQKAVYQRQDEQRGTSSERGYDSKWQRARAQSLAEHPNCATCEADGRATKATLVDHIVPHRGDLTLMWNRRNWQSMCDPCHNRKRQRESMEMRGKPSLRLPTTRIGSER